MFIGAICHDLDHRGFNNKFMIDIGSPLAAIYSTSTMEHHHFNMAVIILQQVMDDITNLFWITHPTRAVGCIIQNKLTSYTNLKLNHCDFAGIPQYLRKIESR